MDQKRPVKIKSDHLRYNDKLKETEFTGHVIATQDSATLFADAMRSSTQGESASASGHLRLLDPERKVEILAEEGDYSGALSEANLKGGVVMHSVDPYAVAVTVTGQSGWYQSVSRQARLAGAVELRRGALTATAERADMDGARDSITLSGKVSALLGANKVEADSAILDGAKKSVCFIGGVKASLIPSQIRERASHPERP
jgi:lipopolysaccharide transport protein LptA